MLVEGCSFPYRQTGEFDHVSSECTTNCIFAHGKPAPVKGKAEAKPSVSAGKISDTASLYE